LGDGMYRCTTHQAAQKSDEDKLAEHEEKVAGEQSDCLLSVCIL
jgi:hypothetical protein